MKDIALPIIRHFVALVVAWLATTVSLTPEEAAGAETALTAAGMLLFGVVWVVIEKTLKPAFCRLLGEK
jgi:Co/Zn/Cd efflux system component